MKKTTALVSALVLGMSVSAAAIADEAKIPMNSTVSSQGIGIAGLGSLTAGTALVAVVGLAALIAVASDDENTTSTP